MKRINYAIVTPARDEAEYIMRTIDSVISQSIVPKTWIIVDDGSTDGTKEIAEQYARTNQFIEVIERQNRGHRKPGSGDIEGANIGLVHIQRDKYDYIVKLDADLILPSDYFEKIFQKFEEMQDLGIAGGHCYQATPRGLKMEKVPDSHVRGATKVYRRACLDSIWPLPEVSGWDTVDELRAQMRGWKTQSFIEPAVIHQKPTTGGASNILKGKFIQGQGCYFLGYHPLFMVCRAMRNLRRQPFLLGGAAMLAGFIFNSIRKSERFEDEQVRLYLRRQQLQRLLNPIKKQGLRPSKRTGAR